MGAAIATVRRFTTPFDSLMVCMRPILNQSRVQSRKYTHARTHAVISQHLHSVPSVVCNVFFLSCFACFPSSFYFFLFFPFLFFSFSLFSSFLHTTSASSVVRSQASLFRQLVETSKVCPHLHFTPRRSVLKLFFERSQPAGQRTIAKRPKLVLRRKGEGLYDDADDTRNDRHSNNKK